MTPAKGKVGITVSIDKDVYSKFLQKVFKQYGRTHGGVISKTIQELIEKYLKEASK